MNNYYNIPPTPPAYTESLDQRVSQVMKRVYVKMFLGLLLTAAVAWGVAIIAPEFQMTLIQNRWIYWGLFIVEILLVLGISGGVSRMKPAAATGLFYLFAIVNGLALSLIFRSLQSSVNIQDISDHSRNFWSHEHLRIFHRERSDQDRIISLHGTVGSCNLHPRKYVLGQLNPRLDHFNCRSDYLYWSDSLGHSEDQNHGSSFKRIQPIVSCNDRCADPIS